ncbi:LAFE_0C06920g1_1 [Lachancea fermentati]|uniref:LAFE_0C06920g1_1 n=1 Tax=Lachancea fermentati TaxID=4955 RepID=A0A1G4M9R2_LACFM|nr:LAFE_0C06920g1_1 [Lachancea fermentati]
MGHSKSVSDVRKRVRNRWSAFEYRRNAHNSASTAFDDGGIENEMVHNEHDADNVDKVGTPAVEPVPLLQTQAKMSSTEINAAPVEIIDLTSDTEETEVTTSDTDLANEEVPLETAVTQYPFKLIKSDIYDAGRASRHFITLQSIFSEPGLKKVWLFSYQYELDYILPMFCDDVEVTIIAQEGTVLPPTIRTASISKLLSKMKTYFINMPPYTCHHSKMIINQYSDFSCRLFIPSNNFTSTETNLPQQVIWCSPILPPKNSVSGVSIFRDDLLLYLDTYPCDLKPLCVAMEAVDFSRIDNAGVQFVFSAPKPSRTKRRGEHITSGIRLAHQKLSKYHHADRSDHTFNATHHYLSQVSTIGAPLKTKSKKPANLFSHLMIPLYSGINPYSTNLGRQRIDDVPETEELKYLYRKHKIKPYIVYPTDREIRSCPMGYMTGGWFHFHWMKTDFTRLHYRILKQWGVLHKQSSEANNPRAATPSHTKFYMKGTTTSHGQKPFEQLDWCLFTTANLSGHAWGTTTRRPQNYEVGVLLCSDEKHALTAKSASDLIYTNFEGSGRSLKDEKATISHNTCILVPFTIPLGQYTTSDESFCISHNYMQPDSLGNQHLAT